MDIIAVTSTVSCIAITANATITYFNNKYQKKFALYNKRMQIYDSVRNLFTYIAIEGDNITRNNTYFEFIENKKLCEFMFRNDSRIEEYLQEIYDNYSEAIKYNAIMIGKEIASEKYKNAIIMRDKHLQWLNEQIYANTLHDIFRPYLQL